VLQPTPMPVGPALGLRAAIARLPSSKIREIAHAGMGRADLIPLWFGERDTPTPKFICDAAARALAVNDTFYQPNAGIHELRATLAEYMNGLYGARLTPEKRDRLGIGDERADAGHAGSG
jgi:aspartate/methionine/tyrosine aminotransferase